MTVRPNRVSNPIQEELDLVAVVVCTRPYSSIELIQLLVRNRFTSLERGREDALAFVHHLRPELVVAVIDTTDVQDLDVIRSLVRASSAHLLVLSRSRDGLAAALRAGADIVASDEDGPEALDAQIASVRRRLIASRAGSTAEPSFRAGAIEFHRAARKVFVDATELFLTNMEYSILLALAENEGRILSALELARVASGRFVAEEEANQTIKVYIRRLRRKLAEAGSAESAIVNVRGRGYILDTDTGTGEERLSG